MGIAIGKCKTTFFFCVVPSVSLRSACLCSIHKGLVDHQLRHTARTGIRSQFSTQ